MDKWMARHAQSVWTTMTTNDYNGNQPLQFIILTTDGGGGGRGGGRKGSGAEIGERRRGGEGWPIFVVDIDGGVIAKLVMVSSGTTVLALVLVLLL